jgi:hypothetical protein
VAVAEANPELGARIVEDAKRYVLYSWSVQDAIAPIAVAGGEGRYFWDYDGKRYLDFASQLVNLSLGHQHPRIVAAIKEQAEQLATIGPPMASESRSKLGRLLAEVTPGDLTMSFFTNSVIWLSTTTANGFTRCSTDICPPGRSQNRNSTVWLSLFWLNNMIIEGRYFDEILRKLYSELSKSSDTFEASKGKGQDLLVQVKKESISTKGPRVTAHVSLPGRFLVYMPGSAHVGVSRKIEDREERARLRALAQEILPAAAGCVIVRTVGEELTRQTFERELKSLLATWKQIQRRASRGRAPASIHREAKLTKGIIRDLFSGKVDSLIIDSREVFEEVRNYLDQVDPSLIERVRLYDDSRPLFDAYEIEAEIHEAFQRKVPLPSGGYIIIEPTEALVSIDVNTGRYTGRRDPENRILYPFNVEMNINHEYWHLRENDPTAPGVPIVSDGASRVDIKFSFGNCLDNNNQIMSPPPFGYVPEIVFRNQKWMDHLRDSRFPALAGWNKSYDQIFDVLNHVALELITKYKNNNQEARPIIENGCIKSRIPVLVRCDCMYGVAPIKFGSIRHFVGIYKRLKRGVSGPSPVSVRPVKLVRQIAVSPVT